MAPEVDHEAELAVVIGKTARDVIGRHSTEHVLGYTCANDVSARRWQKARWRRSMGSRQELRYVLSAGSGAGDSR